MSKTSSTPVGLYSPWQAIGIFVFSMLALGVIGLVRLGAYNHQSMPIYLYIDNIFVFGLTTLLIGLNRPRIYFMSRWTVKWADVGWGILLGLSDRLLLQLMFRLKGESSPAPDRHAVAILCVVLFGPFLEELLCRGVLLRSLLANFQPVLGILLTTFIVAAFHHEFLSVFPGQLILSALYVVSNKSLPSTIICHITMNALTYVWYN